MDLGEYPVVGEDSAPDPAALTDLGDFIAALRRLRLWAGRPTYRELAVRVGPMLRPPQTLSHSTISDLFQPRRRWLDLDLVSATVRAMGLEEPDVARWRAACIRVHAEAKAGGPSGVLRQLPADLATFTGRESVLRELLAAPAAPAGGRARTVVVSAIEGMAGVGKTQLALHTAHELVRSGRYGDVQLFANLRGFDPDHPPADPAAVLAVFLRQLGVESRLVPETLDERAAMLRDRLNGRAAVVVLDNAADEDQVRPLIPASATCLVLVTSRRTLTGLDGAGLFLLDVFSESEAVELLERIIGTGRVRAEAAAARQIVKACGCLPLAVSLVAARLRSKPSWTLADLLQRLRGSGLDAAGGTRRSLRCVFDLSHQALSPSAQRMFSRLALHPGDDLDVFAAAALTGLGTVEAEDLLEELGDHHMIEQHPSGRYAFHDLMREFAREKVTSLSQSARTGCLVRLCDFYRFTAGTAVDVVEPATRHRRPSLAVPTTPELSFESQDEAAAWLNRERGNLLAVAISTVADVGPAHIADLAVILWRYFYDQALFRDGLALHTRAAQACREHGDGPGLAAALRLAATSHIRLGDYVLADTALQESVTIDQDPADLAAGLAALGNLKFQLGAYHDAADDHERALDLHRRIGDRLAEAIDLNNLGTIYIVMGHYLRAIDRLRAALAILATLHTYRHAEVLVTLADVQARLGQYSAALDNLSQAFEVCHTHTIGAVEARAWYQRGVILLRTHDLDGAAHSLDRSLALHVDSGDRTGEAESLTGQGQYHLARGETRQALELFHQAHAIALDLDEPAQRINALNGMGQAHRADGHGERALRAHRDALDSAIALGDPYLIAQSHDGLGHTCRLLGDHHQADLHAGKAASGYRVLLLRQAGERPS